MFTKYSYSGYGIGFDSRPPCSFPNFNWGKSVVILGVGNSSSVHIDNKKKDLLVLGKGPIKEEAEYSINFSRSRKKLC